MSGLLWAEINMYQYADIARAGIICLTWYTSENFTYFWSNKVKVGQKYNL